MTTVKQSSIFRNAVPVSVDASLASVSQWLSLTQSASADIVIVILCTWLQVCAQCLWAVEYSLSLVFGCYDFADGSVVAAGADACLAETGTKRSTSEYIMKNGWELLCSASNMLLIISPGVFMLVLVIIRIVLPTNRAIHLIRYSWHVYMYAAYVHDAICTSSEYGMFCGDFNALIQRMFTVISKYNLPTIHENANKRVMIS